jgi:thiol-disulfide isomerase/thioredoxin
LRFSGALALAVLSIATLVAGADEPKPAPSTPILRLANGGFAPGELQDADEPDVLRWQSPLFVKPFDFLRHEVSSISFGTVPEAPKINADSCVELAGNDVLFGTLVDLNEQTIALDARRFGLLHVDRAKVHRIYRWGDGGDLIYVGPQGLSGWDATAANQWREESGHILTDQPGASVHGDLRVPAKALIEFELAWTSKPDFVLAFGVNDDAKTVQTAFRFEVWEGTLVAHRETPGEADVAQIRELGSGSGRVHLLAYVDQEAGRMIVSAPNGATLGDLSVADTNPRVFGGISLANKHGDVRLERLRIGKWNGEPPRETKSDKSRIHLIDGTILYGQILKFDADAKEYVVHGEPDETRVPAIRIASIYLSAPHDEPARAISAVFQDGSRLSGGVKRVKNGNLRMAIPGFAETLAIPVVDLRSIVILDRYEEPSEKPELTGMLEMEGLRMRGRLVDGRESSGASCLAWKPLGSATASPLRPGVSGRVVYREPPPPPTRPQSPTARAQLQRRVIIRGANGDLIVRNDTAASNPLPPASKAGRAMYLRTGDIVPCEVTKIDETGVWFRTPHSESTFVSQDKLKAVELAQEANTAKRITKRKLDRLLTLPRMQKENPPTHLILSKNGDYLRGRLSRMDEKNLQVEVHLETRELPRDRVSRIIWLHPDELDPAKGAADFVPTAGATRVQAMRSDGIRMTFDATRVEDALVSGKSDVLGACRVRLSDVDQLVFGGAIEKAAAQLAYQQWKLHHAIEPKVSQDDEESSGSGDSTGKESALVGKSAPDFELEMLDGRKFHLADRKGHIVVLDFWATWCGPCLQAMPQVDRVTREFAGQGVQLIAVNLQETSKEISAMLERQKLELTVALDRDGSVAQKYAASAIPQTVIIDREGKIARLFIGGGPHLGDQLRDALQSVVGGNDVKEPVKPSGPASAPGR